MDIYSRRSIGLSAGLILWFGAACYGFQIRDADFGQAESSGTADSVSASQGDSQADTKSDTKADTAGEDTANETTTASTTDTGSSQSGSSDTSDSTENSESTTSDTGTEATAETEGGCDAPLVLCDGDCVDPMTDAEHCGAGPDCIGGQSCADGEVCREGMCACVPDCTGLECGPDPVCGESCGTCMDAGECVEGKCVCEPNCEGRECGSDGCGGSCGMCADGLACDDDAGTCGCTGDQTACGDRCVDLDTSTKHCGACDNECPAGEHASAMCSDGECSIECDEGWLDCDGRPGNGCEAKIDDPATCGSCEKSCEDRPNAQVGCDDAECTYECDDGWANCDDDWDNGCEVDLSSVKNCGACGKACEDAGDNMSVACEEERGEWSCVYDCEDGWGDCNDDPEDGCEVKLDTDDHCGRCGQTCDDDEFCDGGECKCDPMCGDRECGPDPGRCRGVNCGTCDEGWSCNDDGQCIED